MIPSREPRIGGTQQTTCRVCGEDIFNVAGGPRICLPCAKKEERAKHPERFATSPDDETNLTWQKVQASLSRLSPFRDDQIMLLKEQHPVSARHFEQIVRDMGVGFTFVCGCPNNPEVTAFRARGQRLVCCICNGDEWEIS